MKCPALPGGNPLARSTPCLAALDVPNDEQVLTRTGSSDLTPPIGGWCIGGTDGAPVAGRIHCFQPAPPALRKRSIWSAADCLCRVRTCRPRHRRAGPQRPSRPSTRRCGRQFRMAGRRCRRAPPRASPRRCPAAVSKAVTSYMAVADERPDSSSTLRSNSTSCLRASGPSPVHRADRRAERRTGRRADE